MPYIGNTPADKFLTLAKQNFSTSATTSYTLDSAVSSTQDIALFINNVRQSPVDAYTVSGTALTLTSATAGTDEMYCVYLGKTVGTVSPASDSVTTAMLQANAVTGAKLNTDVISAQTALGATPADTDELLVSDAGVLKRVDYSHIKSTAGLTKLASTEVTSGTAAIVFDSSVVTAYDNYYIVVNGIKTAAKAANGAIMFSTDNGSNFIGRAKFVSDYKDLNGGTVGGAHAGTFSLNSVTNPVMWDNHDTEPLCGHFYFYNCNPTTDNTYSVHCGYKASYTNQNDVEYQQDGAVMYDVTAGQQINYFKVVNATQNIDEGRATLYGFNV